MKNYKGSAGSVVVCRVCNKTFQLIELEPKARLLHDNIYTIILYCKDCENDLFYLKRVKKKDAS